MVDWHHAHHLLLLLLLLLVLMMLLSQSWRRSLRCGRLLSRRRRRRRLRLWLILGRRRRRQRRQVMLLGDGRLESLAFDRLRRDDRRCVDVLVAERRADGRVSRVAAGRHCRSTALRPRRARRRHDDDGMWASVHAGTVVFRLVSSVSVVAACLGRCGRLAALLVARRDLKMCGRVCRIVYDVIVLCVRQIGCRFVLIEV